MTTNGRWDLAEWRPEAAGCVCFVTGWRGPGKGSTVTTVLRVAAEVGMISRDEAARMAEVLPDRPTMLQIEGSRWAADRTDAARLACTVQSLQVATALRLEGWATPWAMTEGGAA